MGRAITVLSISCAYALFLILRVKSVFGTKILILSGDNLLNKEGIKLSEGGLLFLWLIAVAGIGAGLYLLLKNIQSKNVEMYEGQFGYKTCPMCAETIKLEAKICKHCRNEFTDDEIETAKEEAAIRQPTNDLYEEVIIDDAVSEEEIIRELGDSNKMSKVSPSQLIKMGIRFDEEDDLKKDDLIDVDQHLEELADKYERIKDGVILEMKKDIIRSDELNILNNFARLDFYQIQDLISNPEDFTESGLRVLSLFEKRIEVAFKNT